MADTSVFLLIEATRATTRILMMSTDIAAIKAEMKTRMAAGSYKRIDVTGRPLRLPPTPGPDLKTRLVILEASLTAFAESV